MRIGEPIEVYICYLECLSLIVCRRAPSLKSPNSSKSLTPSVSIFMKAVRVLNYEKIQIIQIVVNLE